MVTTDIRDQQAKAWENIDILSTQFISSMPRQADVIGNAELAECFATYFGLPSPAVARYVGRPLEGRSMDLYGNLLNTAKSLKGGGHTIAHDQFKWTLYDLLHAGNIDISCEVLNLFSHLIQRRDAFESQTRRQRQAIIPDFMCSAAPPQINLMDVKRLHVGAALSNDYANRRRDGERPVDRRQGRVHRDYHKEARETDKKFNDTPQGSVGPVEARLNSFGTIQGLIVGAFAEGSSHLHHLIEQYANTAANRLWRGMGARNAMEAKNILKQDARRHLGVEMARGNARHKLGRLEQWQGNAEQGNANHQRSRFGARSRQDAYASAHYPWSRQGG